MRPRILITNDDGIYSPGIQALSEAISEIGEITIVAPNIEQSAKSHSITLSNPIKIRFIKLNNGINGWAVDGTPVDCTKIAIKSILNHKPDLIISGINQGANLGRNMIYSGTISAAYEGAILGIPSMAISLASYRIDNFIGSKFVAQKIARHLLKYGIPKGTMLNVNVPYTDLKNIRGNLITRQGNQYFIDDFEKRVDPRKQTYYWMKGKIVDHDSSLEYDGKAVAEGYVSITPINFNITNESYMNELNRQFLDE